MDIIDISKAILDVVWSFTAVNSHIDSNEITVLPMPTEWLWNIALESGCYERFFCGCKGPIIHELSKWEWDIISLPMWKIVCCAQSMMF